MPTSPHLTDYPWLAAPLGEENPQPVFRDPDPDMPVTALDSLPSGLGESLGRGCGRRVLPYRLQDRYTRERRVRDFRAVVLENENLRATFLPELGGRLISLVHLPAGRELLFRNPVFQPANLALRDAWFAGGIEWNIGQFGHAFHTCSPVFAATIPGLDATHGLRLYDFDRVKGLLWQIDFHLPPGAEFLHAFTRVVNPRDEAIPMYWWTNVAVADHPGLRVLAPASESIYVDYGRNGTGIAYGMAALPGLPTIGGRDGSYARNLDLTNEFFFQCQSAELPWQAALDGDGTGFAEVSTHPLDVRKLFCWGTHQGGRHWNEFLAEPGLSYIELQAGLAPTQQHTREMPPFSEWCWIQSFGQIRADNAKVHGTDWNAACGAVEAALRQKINPDSLRDIQSRCAELADIPPLEILSPGSGWGALEARRRAARGEPPLPAGLDFSESTLGAGQQPWVDLLLTGKFPGSDPALPPGDWMVQPEWRTLLENSPAQDWFAKLHLGVMRMEAGDEAGAVDAWEESIRLRPSAWAWRNLGAAAVRRGDPAAALPAYRNAWDIAAATGRPDISFAIEYLDALHAAGSVDEGWAFYHEIPAVLRREDKIHLLAAKIALARRDLDFVEAALAEDYASIREGARDLTELWFGLQAARAGIPAGDARMKKLESTCPPPARIDFRVVE